jgi:hypothetical protein
MVFRLLVAEAERMPLVIKVFVNRDWAVQAVAE